MTNKLHLTLAACLMAGLGTGAYAQDYPAPPPASGVSYGEPGPEAEAGPDQAQDGQAPAEAPRRRHARAEIRPYLEVTQVLSAELGDGGETLTYTSVAAGVDGSIQTRRVTAQMSYRYERHIEYDGNVPDRDIHSGLAAVNVQVVPGALTFDAGALATRTAGDGRAIGVSTQDQAVNVYSVYAGPTLSTHAGPVAVNAAYRLGYVKIDDDRIAGTLDDDFDSATAHSATASVGMAPGGPLPFGWTVGAGYAREDSGGRFEQRFEGMYARADVVVPLSSTLAVTAGVGYEDIQASQNDILRDGGGLPVLDPAGRPIADPSRPRLLTYDMDGVMYDAGIIWRPTARTELQARAGRRYGGTTVIGSLSHQINDHAALNAAVFDSVTTFGNQLNNDLSSLPDDFDVSRDPVTGNLGGCAFGRQGGGACLGRSLQSIRGNSFRMRGGSITFSGERRLWTWGIGAGYTHRRYARPNDPVFDPVIPREDEDVSVYASLGRQLSRTSNVDLNVYASWYDSDLAGANDITSLGATASYSRTFLLDRLQLLAAMGIYNTDDGVDSSTNASGQLGLRYTFW
ncbi:MAG TPA: hypothetical protein VLK25_07155 [Allosphingosinicella sp.]|nr:hypothetical protein [Allosphingosinicella sp.]